MYKLCPDVDYMQKSTTGFRQEPHQEVQMKYLKIPKGLQWMSMEGLENHKQLVCINHDFVHKAKVDPPPVNRDHHINQLTKIRFKLK